MKKTSNKNQSEITVGSIVCSIIVILTIFNGATRLDHLDAVTDDEENVAIIKIQDESFLLRQDCFLQKKSTEEVKYESKVFLPDNISTVENQADALVKLVKFNEELMTAAMAKTNETGKFACDTPKIILFGVDTLNNSVSQETVTAEKTEEVDEVYETETSVEDTDNEEKTEISKDVEVAEETESADKVEEVAAENAEEAVEVTEVAVVDEDEEVVETEPSEETEDATEVAMIAEDEQTDETEPSDEEEKVDAEEYSRDVQLLAGIMYLEEGCYANIEEGEYIHKLAGSAVLHRVESDLYPDTIEGVLYDPGQYGSRTKRLIDTVEIPEKVYDWAEELLAEGPIGPKNLVFQAGSKQGEVYYEYKGQYFCLSSRIAP